MLKNFNYNLRNMSRKKLLGLTTITVLAFGIGFVGPRFISYSITDSLSYNWFIVKRGVPEALQNGDYVIFPVEIEKEIVENCNPCNVTKKVSCLPGQHLATHKEDFYCDGKYIGKAKKSSKTGVEVKHFVYDGKVPEDKFFMTGETIDSYDSRYFGFVEKEKILGKALPLY